jgi:hypothetical protein
MGMVIREVCPRCKSATYKKNGHIHNGKQNHQCKTVAVSLSIVSSNISSRMQPVISLSVCGRNASRFEGYVVLCRWDSSGC